MDRTDRAMGQWDDVFIRFGQTLSGDPVRLKAPSNDQGSTEPTCFSFHTGPHAPADQERKWIQQPVQESAAPNFPSCAADGHEGS